jgi:hypothetical protein
MTVFDGHIRANLELDGSTYELRVEGKLEYRSVGDGYRLSGYDENGRGLSIWLPERLTEGQREYDLSHPGHPEINFIVRRIISPLRSGVLSVTVNDDVLCEGTFNGVDERGRTFSDGSFSLQKH